MRTNNYPNKERFDKVITKKNKMGSFFASQCMYNYLPGLGYTTFTKSAYDTSKFQFIGQLPPQQPS